MSKEGRCITAEMKKDRASSDKNKYYWMWREEKKKIEELQKENKELKEDNKKISRQIEDRIDRMRKSGM
jgi:predicted nuclease with TOPRIM domain